MIYSNMLLIDSLIVRSRDCSDSMKDSLASALRHTRKQAQETYDRRTSNEKKARALAMTTQYAQTSMDAIETRKQARDEPKSRSLDIGAFVGLIEEDSTMQKPKVLIGQIQFLLEVDNRASLLWYKHISSNQYTFQFQSEEWIENLEAMIPVTMKANKQSPGTYKLSNTLRSIHKKLMR